MFGQEFAPQGHPDYDELSQVEPTEDVDFHGRKPTTHVAKGLEARRRGVPDYDQRIHETLEKFVGAKGRPGKLHILTDYPKRQNT